MHGGKSPGPPQGNQNAFKHGDRARLEHLLAQRRQARALLKRIEALL